LGNDFQQQSSAMVHRHLSPKLRLSLFLSSSPDPRQLESFYSM
jgi:hypothetical protein